MPSSWQGALKVKIWPWLLKGFVDGGKNPSQQRETFPVPQVPIRLTAIWNGRLDGIMDPLTF